MTEGDGGRHVGSRAGGTAQSMKPRESGESKPPHKPRTRTRTWTRDELRDLATTAVPKEPEDGYWTINKRALSTLVSRAFSGYPPTHAQTAILLWLLARAGRDPGEEGFVRCTQASLSEFLGPNAEGLARHTAALEVAGFLVELKHGKSTVGYQIPADVFDWLTHPTRHPLPQRVKELDLARWADQPHR